jgi:hypothetical protein
MTTCSDNTNPLYTHNFNLKFNRGTKQFELLCQRANLPGISVPDLVQPTTLGTTVPVPSLIATFEPLTVEFIVDENMDNWKSLYSWIRNVTNIQDDSSNNLDYKKWHITATLNIYTKQFSLQNCDPPTTIVFTNIVPVALSGLNFQYDNTDAVIQKATAKFKYSYYTITPDAPSLLA